MRFLTILGKTVGDLSNPKLLAGYLVPYCGVLLFAAMGLSNNIIADDVATMALAQQEAQLLGPLLAVTFIWGAGIAVLGFGAVFGAVTLANELQVGTLRILLSKPVRRWEVLAGTVAGIVGYLTLAGVASVLLGALAMSEFAGVSAAALDGGAFAVLPATALYLLFLSAFTASVTVALAVFTRDRLRTALGGLVLPAMFFVCWFLKNAAPSFYEDNYVYLVDVGYHLGNVYVLVLDAVGGEIPFEARTVFGMMSGLYDVPEEAFESGSVESLELVGYVEPAVSLAALGLLSVVLLAGAGYRFGRMDV